MLKKIIPTFITELWFSDTPDLVLLFLIPFFFTNSSLIQYNYAYLLRKQKKKSRIKRDSEAVSRLY